MDRKTIIVLVSCGIAALLALSGVAVLFVFGPRPAAVQPSLSREVGLEALKPELFAECRPDGMAETYRSCSAEIAKEGEGWRVAVTYEGLYDDSIKASRVEAYIASHEGQWTASGISHASQCQSGRGHQDFSTEPCV